MPLRSRVGIGADRRLARDVPRIRAVRDVRAASALAVVAPPVEGALDGVARDLPADTDVRTQMRGVGARHPGGTAGRPEHDQIPREVVDRKDLRDAHRLRGRDDEPPVGDRKRKAWCPLAPDGRAPRRVEDELHVARHARRGIRATGPRSPVATLVRTSVMADPLGSCPRHCRPGFSYLLSKPLRE